MLLQVSNRKAKRLMAMFSNGKVVHFGSSNGTTFIDGANEAKKRAYLARHGKNNENWDDPYTPGALSKWILWGDSPSLITNYHTFIRHFNLN